MPVVNKPKQILRLAELLTSLSLAIDLGMGQPMEFVMQTCLLGVQLSKILGFTVSEQHEVYYLSLLRHIGCTSTAISDVMLFGDDLSLSGVFAIDTEDLTQVLPFMFSVAGKGEPLLQRLQRLPNLLMNGKQIAQAGQVGRCEVAALFAERLALPVIVRDSLWQIYERWDGRGIPKQLKGDEISSLARVIHIAQDGVTFFRIGGVDTAVEMIQRRSGHIYDPAMSEIFCRDARYLLPKLNVEPLGEAVLAAEPAPLLWLDTDGLDKAFEVMADFTDFKAPYTRGHSRAVARLAENTAHVCGLPESDAMLLRQTGFLHDIGRVGISAAIWDKQGTLNESEWERVRLHPYLTERILARSGHLSSLGVLAATHHERLDGSGYHRGLKASDLPMVARILITANSYCALCEERPHRPQRTTSQAADELHRQVRGGKLDAHIADAVLSAAGHPIRADLVRPASLSEREIEVLRLIGRGLSNRQIAKALVISEKTVEHHVTHIYNKIGVVSRAGATVYAMQNHLLNDVG